MLLKKTLMYSVLLMISVVLLAGCGAKSNSDNNSGAVGKVPAYNFKLKTLDGKTVTLDDFKGKVLIVDVWDTWCPPCKAEIPHFIELYSKYKSKGLEILGVAGGRYGEEAVRKFIQEYGINYRNAIATPEFIQGFGGIRNIPTTFVIDKQGRIYQKYVGYRDKEVFETDIKAILNL